MCALHVSSHVSRKKPTPDRVYCVGRRISCSLFFQVSYPFAGGGRPRVAGVCLPQKKSAQTHGLEDSADRQPARDHSSSSPTFYGNPHDSPDPHVSHVSHVPRQYRPHRTIRPESHEPPDLPTALRHVGAHQHMHHTQRTALPRSTHHTSRLATSRASRRPPRTPTARAHPTISSTRRRGASSCSTCTMSRNLTPHTTRWPRPLSFPSL